MKENQQHDVLYIKYFKLLTIISCLFTFISFVLNFYVFFETNIELSDNVRSYIKIEVARNLEGYLNGIQRFSLRNRRDIRQLSNKKLKDTQTVQVEDNTVTPDMEFFSHKFHQQLEVKEDLDEKRTEVKGQAPGDDTWVWLTNNARVPYNVVREFCKATQDYCPKSLPGLRGEKGDRGESGMPGYPGGKGLPGSKGEPGHPGNKGDKGERGLTGPQGLKGHIGKPGLDGRDGVPGEPGLDGTPGRNGADGSPGKDGTDGANGRDGMPGKNGKDGKDGKIGNQGPPGPRGPEGRRGMPGQKGNRGDDGKNGEPGQPGVNFWKYKENGEFLIPPSFTKLEGTTIVEEGNHLRVKCPATGKPEPKIEWRRQDNKPIVQGSWRDMAIIGEVLNITYISRHHAGKYICSANNGVPPPANFTVNIEVNFSPYIRVPNNVITSNNYSIAHLECEVQAWPKPDSFTWEKDNIVLEGSKYKSELLTTDVPWRWIMVLQIHHINKRDNGQYTCTAKNSVINNSVKGYILLQDSEQSKLFYTNSPTEWGVKPPVPTSHEDICQVNRCPACPRCDKPKLIITYLKNATTVQTRKSVCVLYAVGKPVYHGNIDESFGAWLKDSSYTNHDEYERIWTTDENDVLHLKEYENKDKFKNNQPTRVYTLPIPFFGNGHIIYNGSFFYQENNTGAPGDLIKYDLATDKYTRRTLPNAGGLLYTSSYNQVDYNVDDNGLWAVYSIKNSNNTAVAKISYNDDMRLDFILNISLNHKQMGEMFIVCGILYALDSNTERDTKISTAIDLYQRRPIDISIPFTNPFKKTTQLSYDMKHKELYSSDKGNQLTYPVRANENDSVN